MRGVWIFFCNGEERGRIPFGDQAEYERLTECADRWIRVREHGCRHSARVEHESAGELASV